MKVEDVNGASLEHICAVHNLHTFRLWAPETYMMGLTLSCIKFKGWKERDACGHLIKVRGRDGVSLALLPCAREPPAIK